MSNLTVSETFAIDAPPATVWAYLIDPHRIVGCLPGAELTGQEGDDTFLGTVSVKVGALSLNYRGKVVFEDIDETRLAVRIVGTGREKAGSGTATMTMQSQVTPTATGASALSVNADVRLTGRIVRFGRGLIQSVSTEILSSFMSALADMIRNDAAASAVSSPSSHDTIGGDATEERTASETISVFALLMRSLRRWFLGLFSRTRGAGRAGPPE